MTDLELRRGDTGIWDLQFSTAAGSALNLVGATLRFTAKYSPADADAAAVIRKDSAGLGGIVVTNAGAGQARLTVLPADTAALTSDVSLSYDVQVTEASGAVTTVLDGTLTVKLDVTQAS